MCRRLHRSWYPCSRQTVGAVLTVTGMLLIFLCLPMQFYLIVLGALLAAAGLALLGVRRY